MRGRLHRTPQRLPALLARRSSAPPGHVSEVGAFEPDESGGSSTSGSEPVTVRRLQGLGCRSPRAEVSACGPGNARSFEPSRGRAETGFVLVLHPPSGTTWRNCGANRGGAGFLIPARCAAPFTICQISFGVMPSPQTLPIRFTRRKIVPPLISAHAIHASMARFTQPGTGTVRMCFPLPIAHDDVIRHLCEELNATETLFPGTGLKLIYKLGSS